MPAAPSSNRGASSTARAVRTFGAFVAGALVVAGAGITTARPAAASTRTFIVRARGPRVPQLVRDASALGAHVVRRLPIIDGLVMTASPSALTRVRALPETLDAEPDARVDFASVDPKLGYDALGDYGSLYDITRIIGAQDAWRAGYTGKGIDVALIDTGVAAVKGLTSGNVVNGPDLSFDSQSPKRTDRDGYGHGTHMASLIAGRDTRLSPGAYANPAVFAGVAPDARVVSVKVGAADGAADVSQVIAAIDWVVQHRKDHGFNIRVLSLSFGTNSTQDYRRDPLAYAAERAWRAGITVVASGGNDGTEASVLADPAMDPLPLAVGASDPGRTLDARDDTVPDFSARGSISRHVDVMAPGVHVLGLRSPGSYVDMNYPSARVGSRFFRGSGTSQATALTAGAVALFLQRYPTATPDEVKHALMTNATRPLGVSPLLAGAGTVQVRRAQHHALAASTQPTTLDGNGTGSIELARGTSHVDDGVLPLTGEQDIFGAPWVGRVSAALAHTRTSWTGGVFNGTAWTGSSWTGVSWTTKTWANVVWSLNTWTGRRWTDVDWSGRRWTSTAWAVGAWR